MSNFKNPEGAVPPLLRGFFCSRNGICAFISIKMRGLFVITCKMDLIKDTNSEKSSGEKRKKKRGRSPVLIAGGIFALLSGAAQAQQQGLTQTFDRPLSTGLSLGTQFFQSNPKTPRQPLQVKSMVVGETSDTQGAVTVPVPKELDMVSPTAPVVTPIPLPVAPEKSDLTPDDRVVSQGLPVKVDNSSTAAQLLQLANFEKRNQIGEAFLLASELVRQNPDEEFAYDAVIRMSLILGLDSEIEKFYREAIKRSSLSGKYYVQLAHYYQRKGQMKELQALIEDYAKSNSDATDYRITLARLFSVAGDPMALKALFDRQGFTQNDIFPLLQLQMGTYVELKDSDKATSIVLSALDRDFGMAEYRLLLMDYLRLPSPDPATSVLLLQMSLANETDYDRARGLADTIISRSMEGRYFSRLRNFLLEEGRRRRLRDVERWLLSLMADKTGDTKEALEILTAETAGNTPTIAYERAARLAKTNRSREAIPILQTLLAEQPDNLQLRLLLAGQLYGLKQSTNTLQLLSPLRFDNLSEPQQVEVVNYSIGALLQREDTSRILSVWAEIAPQASFKVMQSMGDTIVQNAKNAEFRARLAGAALAKMQTEPASWSLNLLLSRLASLDEDHIAELTYYSRYLDNDSDNIPMLKFVAELALQRSTVPLQLGTLADGEEPVALRGSNDKATEIAIDLYRRLIDLQPRLSENYSALMRAYQTRGEIETAKKVAVEFADRSTSTAVACASAAEMLAMNGFDNDALVYYRESVLKDPQNFQVWMDYAATLRRVGKVELAEGIFKRILEEGFHGNAFNQPEIFANLLGIAEDNKSVDQLATYLDSLREKSIPGKAEFYISSAKVFMQLGMDAKAEEFLTAMQKEFPDHKLTPESYLLLGQLQYARQDIEKARTTFAETAEKFTTGTAAVTARFNEAELVRQQGNVAEALKKWEELAEKYPSEDKALSGLYTAALSAYNDANNTSRSEELLVKFLESESMDFDLQRKAAQGLKQLREGKSPEVADKKATR